MRDKIEEIDQAEECDRWAPWPVDHEDREQLQEAVGGGASPAGLRGKIEELLLVVDC